MTFTSAVLGEVERASRGEVRVSDGCGLKFHRCPSRSQILRKRVVHLQTAKSNNAFSPVIARIILLRRLLTNADFTPLIAVAIIQQLPVYRNKQFSYVHLMKISLASAVDIFTL